MKDENVFPAPPNPEDFQRDQTKKQLDFE